MSPQPVDIPEGFNASIPSISEERIVVISSSEESDAENLVSNLEFSLGLLPPLTQGPKDHSHSR